jgi:hypothetical protein
VEAHPAILIPVRSLRPVRHDKRHPSPDSGRL